MYDRFHWYFFFLPVEEVEQRPFCSFCMKIQILPEKKSEKKSVFPVGEIWGANSYFFS